MFAADERNALAETGAKNLDQRVLMGLLDLCHVFEHFGRGRILLPQAIGIAEIDTGILFFGGNRQREDFFFRQ
ncbi:hypothetical protein D3C87_1596060 [compost metagenome]